MKDGFVKESPVARVRVAKPKPKVVVPYSGDEIRRMLAVCDYDYDHNARFAGSRNRAIILGLLDTGVRLSELINMKVRDINTDTGCVRVLGKGNKERVVRVGKVALKALWRYLMCRGRSNVEQLWLTEEGRPMQGTGVQALVKRLKERAGVIGEGSVHGNKYDDIAQEESYTPDGSVICYARNVGAAVRAFSKLIGIDTKNLRGR